MKLEPGAQVTPNVRLVRRLGEGGMGEVWAAEHLALGTEVAVKFLLGDYAKDEAARARFSQEAAAASRVKSSHVVKVYDYGITDGDVPFIVMEMLEGSDLAERILQQHKLAPTELVPIVHQLCKALERAHEKGVIHRDIKPENVFLGNEGGEVFVKLLDFGIAKTETLLRKTTGNRRSTMAGESLGTPYYMSPEQFRSAKEIDARSDLWSVGVLAYEALTGSLPYVADTVSALAVLVNECKAAPPSSVEPTLPAAFDTWFAKACARDPADRFQTARELSSALAVAFGSAPESSANTTGPRHIVISAVDSGELAAISLRDTAFATAGGSPKVAPRKRAFPIVLGALAFASALAIAWVSWPRSESKPVVTASSSIPAATLTTTTNAIASTAVSAPTASSTSEVAVMATTSASHAAAVVTVRPKASASASAGPHQENHHGDIW